ncbi:hypothetical protein [Streptomyces sp. NPDC060065]|uniref:hypothetical protein n=1 Tax=Streptomyces sp. NPDC060065 TaxID=3347050 RepID=UPI0036ACE1E6
MRIHLPPMRASPSTSAMFRGRPRAPPCRLGSPGGRTSAITAGAYSVSSNQWNPDPRGTAGEGLGWVVAPDGEVLATSSAEEPFRTVEIDLDLARRAKSTYPRYVLI